MESGRTDNIYEYIFNLSHDAITLIDENYRYTLANPAFCDSMQLPSEEVLASHVSDI